MKQIVHVLTAVIAMGVIPVASAGPLEELLDKYAVSANTSVKGFSADRGEQLHNASFSTGKPDTPSCSTCHASDPAQTGRTRTGKSIDPVALSVSPSRYLDPAKVEKWFKRNCTEVLGRECTPLEKGDWLTYVKSR